MTRLVLTLLAEQDLEEIGDYIAQDHPRRALSFVRELRKHCEKIASNPAGYRRRLELADDIRSCTHGHYVIFFVATPDKLKIVRVLHGARDIANEFSAQQD